MKARSSVRERSMKLAKDCTAFLLSYGPLNTTGVWMSSEHEGQAYATGGQGLEEEEEEEEEEASLGFPHRCMSRYSGKTSLIAPVSEKTRQKLIGFVAAWRAGIRNADLEIQPQYF